MTFPETIKIWADTLTDKHECGTEYAIRATLTIDSEPEPIEVWMPDHVDGAASLQFRAFVRFGDLILLVALLPVDEDDEESIEPRTFLMVARAHEDGSYHCVVWHELWDLTLERLGLDQKAIPARITSIVHEPERPDEDAY